MINNLNGYQQLFNKYLSFHEELLKGQLRNMQRLMAVISFQQLNEIDIEAKIENGEYIITSQNILLQEKELEDIFDDIFSIIKKYYSDSKELKRIEDLNDKRKFSLKSLVEKLLSQDNRAFDSLAKELNLPQKSLKKISEYILSPYLELCAEYFNKKLQNHKWEKSICPICGSLPSMALVNERERCRLLWCRLCDTEWKFNENTCPFCLNNDLKSIKYIFPPDKSPNRIDACENCKRYLKTIDEHLILKRPKLVVEYLATFHLDILAISNGFRNYQI